MCLFKYGSQVEDVSKGQALTDKCSLIFGVSTGYSGFNVLAMLWV